MTEGWMCPKCKKAHGPALETCPEPTRGEFFRKWPLHEYDEWPVGWPRMLAIHPKFLKILEAI